KGIEVILGERGLWTDGWKLECSKPQCEGCCCAHRILSQPDDFQQQKGKLQEMIELTGHKIIFHPKFHCELNWIEYYWGQVKRYAYKNCEHNYLQIIPVALASVNPLTIRLFYARVQRITKAYCQEPLSDSKGYEEYLSHCRIRHLKDDF
ncbi:hypothetical protein C7212DRAFT_173969, partial [Tuber magnatum]